LEGKIPVKIVTANTTYEVTMNRETGLFHAVVMEGKNKGAFRDGETISGTKMGAQFVLISNGQAVIKSSTVQSVSGSL
jgi:hypothetical protein